jgi:amino acid adenylation domain-containing protein
MTAKVGRLAAEGKAGATFDSPRRVSPYRASRRIELRTSTATADDPDPVWLADDPRALDWNGPSRLIFRRFRDEDLGRPILEHLARVTRAQPDCVAVADGETSLTFAELWAGLSGLAETLAAASAPGELIGILLPASPLAPLAMLACLAAGRPFVMLDPHYPGDWLSQVLEDARPAVMISREDLLAGVDTGAARVIPLTALPQPAAEGWRPAAMGVDEPACVLFTSGSTGRPKGVVNSQRNLLQRVAQSVNAGHINTDDRFLTLASLATIVGVRDVMTALLAAGSVHLLDPQRVGAREIREAVRDQAITVLFAFPALLRSVVGAGREPVGPTLRLVRIGGDTTLWSDIDLLRGWLAPGAAIQLIYAATEAPMMQWFVDPACKGEDARIPIGYPLPGNALAILDEDGTPTPPGEAGEMVVSSPYVALGHWIGGRSVPDGFDGGDLAPGRMFRTGDLVRQRPDGMLERLGRRDRQVKIRGVRVELDGVEAALREHPGVRDVGVLVRTSPTDGAATLVAYVRPRDGTSAALLEALKVRMLSAPAAMRPGRLYLADEIPRLPSSKLDVRALAARDEATARAERAGGGAPRQENEGGGDRVVQAVTQVWWMALERAPGGPDEDFFDAGGDSLKAISLMVELEQALGVELPLTLINEAPTFGGLVAALKAQTPAEYSPLVLLKAGEGAPPVFFVHGIGGNVVDLFPIARAMTYAGPVIGLQARGLSAGQRCHHTVEAMAEDYLAAVRARQPQGPYHLCGYSFGGLVAFEMARRLAEAGETAALVGLFDTMTSTANWPAARRFGVTRLRLKGLAGRIRGAPGERRVSGGPSVLQILLSGPERVRNVRGFGLLASARYRPGVYDGTLTLFSPVDRDPTLPSLEEIWGSHARAVTTVATAGDHLTMLAKPNAESAAEALTHRLPASA